MEETFSPETEIKAPVRPAVLSLLCILTFIGSGLAAFSFLMMGLFYPAFVEVSMTSKMALPEVGIIIKNTPPWAFLLAGLSYTISLSGALMMWKLRKTGFHAYTLAQFSLLFITTFAIYPRELAGGDLLFSTMFVLLYASHLKLMK